MKWFRCNNCYCKLETAEEPFHLTKCGHVYCSSCINQAERQCPICNTVNVPKICLKDPLEHRVGQYFTSMTDSLQQLLEVAHFQDEQLRVTMKKLAETEAKYAYYKDICRKLEIGAARIHKKYRQAREYITRIGSLQNEVKQSKPTLEEALISPPNKYCNSQNIAGSSGNLHNCSNRLHQSESKVAFFTSLSKGSNINSNASPNSGRRYLATTAEPNGLFQVPNITRVPRSAGTRSSASTAGTPISYSDKSYFASMAVSDRPYQISNIMRIPRSAGTRSSASTAGTSASMSSNRLKLNSLRISRS